MALEPDFRWIDDLVPTNPAVNDPVAQGDDHLRGIKLALQGSVTGNASEVRLRASGASLAVALANRFRIQASADGVTRGLSLRNAADDTDAAYLEFRGASNALVLSNETDEGLIFIQGRKAGGGVSSIFSGDPQGPVVMRFDGTERAATTNSGFTVSGGLFSHSAGAASVDQTLLNVAGGARWRLQDSNGTFTLSQLAAAGGFEGFWAQFSRNGGYSFYFDGALTLAGASDGITILGTAPDSAIMRLQSSDQSRSMWLAFNTTDDLELRNFTPGGNVSARVEPPGGGAQILWLGVPDGVLTLRANNAERFRTVVAPAIPNSGAELVDGEGTWRPAGYNTLPDQASTLTARGVSPVDNGRKTRMTNAAPKTLTLDTGVSADFCAVYANDSDADLAIALGGNTLIWFTGTSRETGARTVGPGGVITLARRGGTNAFDIWGSGLS